MVIDLIVKTYVDGVDDPYFPLIKGDDYNVLALEDVGTLLLENSDKILTDNSTYLNSITEVDTYTYSSQRMGAVPSITAVIKSYICLDSYWNNRQYIIYNDEKYFAFNIPTSSKKNTDGRYEYNVIFNSERYELNGVYFFDVVGEDSSYAGGYISNSTNFGFLGDIYQFAERLQASIDYNNLNYTVIVDEGIVSEDVAVSFDNTYILEALQQSFDLYDIPHYFKGREIHFGYTDNAITEVFEYGDSLLEITKTNADYKKITYCSGIGSDENIPYYYPNEADINVEKNKIPVIVEADLNETCDNLNIPLITNQKETGIQALSAYRYDGMLFNYNPANEIVVYLGHTTLNAPTSISFNIGETTLTKYWNIASWGLYLCVGQLTASASGFITEYEITQKTTLSEWSPIAGGSFTVDIDRWDTPEIDAGEYDVFIIASSTMKNEGNGKYSLGVYIDMPAYTIGGAQYQYYVFDIDTVVDYIENTLIPNHTEHTEELLALAERTKANIAKMNEVVERMPTTQNLMPPIFRETITKERFYPAKNNTYLLPDGSGGYYEFENEYADTIIKEQVIESFEDIKPTIEGVRNAKGDLIATITDFAYDENDNDDFVLDEAGNLTDTFQHPYFYLKLKKFDGVDGFDLFASSIDSGEMTINIRTGDLAGTAHIVQSLKEEALGQFVFYNPVQVDNDGNIVSGDWQDKINTNISKAQAQQQNTQTNEIWIAVTKDIDTYGVLMPNVNYGYRPHSGDEFNITNIFLPQGYITSAEKRLEDAIIKYMWENNTEKFNFSVKFSRVFLADNPTILAQLNENARLSIKYDDKIITSYISNFSYKSPNETEPLPEITITLTDTLSVQQGKLQNSLTEIKNDILSSSPASADFLKLGLKYFLRKDVEDTAQAPIKFASGAYSKDYREGGFAGNGWAVYQKPDGTSLAEFDELVVRKTATFNELIINQISFTLGQTVFTNGGFEITKVEETSDYIRCYYDNKNGGRLAGIVVDDFVRCQEYDPYYNNIIRYYSRAVVNVGEDYVDLSKTDFNGIGIPQIGDNCVQWGNSKNFNRQFAIIRNVSGGGYDQFLWGIDNVSSVGTQYYFVGWRNTQDPTLQFGDETIGGLKCVLGFENIEGIITPNVSLDIWANTINIKTPSGNYENIEEKLSASDYLIEATQKGQTTLSGGVVMSNIFGVTEIDDPPILENIQAGISGLKDDNIAFFADGKGAYEKAVEFLQDPTNLANILNFLVTDAGKVYMKNALIVDAEIKNAVVSGRLDGVTGSFEQLTTKNGEATISFSDIDGLFFSSEAITHNGGIFRAGDMSVRGGFGFLALNYISVENDQATYFVNGDSLTTQTLTSKVSGSGNTYWEIPLYGIDGDISGVSFNLIMINSNSTYRYSIINRVQYGSSVWLPVGADVKVINVSQYNNIYIYINGTSRAFGLDATVHLIQGKLNTEGIVGGGLYEF